MTERMDSSPRIARHPLISLALLLDLFLTDGALAMMVDALPNELANPPNSPADNENGD